MTPREKILSALLLAAPKAEQVYSAFAITPCLTPEQMTALIECTPQETQQALDALVKAQLLIRRQANTYCLNPDSATVLPLEPEPAKIGILKYAGIAGIQHAFKEVLVEAMRQNAHIDAIESGADIAKLGNDFVEHYIQERINQQITAYVITPDTAEDRQYQADYEGKYTHVKILETGAATNLDLPFNVDANINIVGDLVMTFSLDPIEGTIRRNRAEARTMHSIFQMLWHLGR